MGEHATPSAALVARFEGAVECESHGQSVVYLDRTHLADAVAYLRAEEQFSMLMDVTAVDHLRTAVRTLPAAVAPEPVRSRSA